MKKGIAILVFGILYILIFTFIYIFKFYNIDSFALLLIIITGYSFPSLISVLILILIEKQFKLKINQIFYLLLSIFIFYISFIFWNLGGHNTKTIQQSISNETHIMIYYALLSHLLAYGIFMSINYIKNRIDAA